MAWAFAWPECPEETFLKDYHDDDDDVVVVDADDIAFSHHLFKRILSSELERTFLGPLSFCGSNVHNTAEPAVGEKDVQSSTQQWESCVFGCVLNSVIEIFCVMRWVVQVNNFEFFLIVCSFSTQKSIEFNVFCTVI